MIRKHIPSLASNITCQHCSLGQWGIMWLNILDDALYLYFSERSYLRFETSMLKQVRNLCHALITDSLNTLPLNPWYN